MVRYYIHKSVQLDPVPSRLVPQYGRCEVPIVININITVS